MLPTDGGRPERKGITLLFSRQIANALTVQFLALFYMWVIPIILSQRKLSLLSLGGQRLTQLWLEKTLGHSIQTHTEL